MNQNNRSLPFDDDWGPLNRRKQRADREQRAYQRRLQRLRARDRKWGKRSSRLREEIRAAFAVTLPVARGARMVRDLLDEQGLAQ